MDGMRARTMKPEARGRRGDEPHQAKGRRADVQDDVHVQRDDAPERGAVGAQVHPQPRGGEHRERGQDVRPDQTDRQVDDQEREARRPGARAEQYPDTQAIVFVNTKRAVDAVVAQCQKMGYSVAPSTAGRARTSARSPCAGLHLGEYDVLVATDVAGRGIDVKGIDLVVNYELPHVIENYTHRIGRTGRAGRQGTAVAFVTSEDTDVMYELKELLKNSGNHVPGELANHQASQGEAHARRQGQQDDQRTAQGDAGYHPLKTG